MLARFTAAFSLLLGAASLGGCRSTAKTETVATLNTDRELETFLDADLLTVHEAARWVLVHTFHFKVIADERDARMGLIRARTPEDGMVRVETYRDGRKRTKVQVFVAPLGDENRQREILRAIEDRL